MDQLELLKEAQLLFVHGKHKESVEAFTKALEEGAEPYIAYLSRGAAYLKADETEKAIHDFTQAIDANSQGARAYYFRGIVHLMREEFEKAVSDFTKALELKTDYAIAQFSRSVAYARLNMTEEASKDMMHIMPQMEENIQSFADSHGIIRTQLTKVMGHLDGEKPWPTLDLGEKEMDTLMKWLKEE
jgi:tetratricopeptide (TPR) repeat protein